MGCSNSLEAKTIKRASYRKTKFVKGTRVENDEDEEEEKRKEEVEKGLDKEVAQEIENQEQQVLFEKTEIVQQDQEIPDESQSNQNHIDELIGKQIPKFVVEEIKESTIISSQDEQEIVEVNHDVEIKMRQSGKAKKKMRNVHLYDKIFENVLIEGKELDQSAERLIQESFMKHFVFFNLSSIALQSLMKEMFYCTQVKDQYIFKQEDQASTYFVIESGEVEVKIDGKHIRYSKAGDSFGELALLYGVQRSATIQAKSDCSFWGLDRTTFKNVIEFLISQEWDENRKFIEQVSFFQAMTQHQKNSIVGSLITSRYPPGTDIVTQDSRADTYFIIKQGQVVIIKDGQELRKMGALESFGEQALYVTSTRQATVKAISEVTCLSLGRDQLTKILGDKVQVIIFFNQMRWMLKQSSQLSCLTDLQVEKILQAATIKNYKKGYQVLKKGEICNQFIQVLEGSLVDISNNKIIVSKGLLYCLYKLQGNSYGDQYLLNSSRSQKLEQTLQMENDGVLSIIEFSTLFKVLGGELEVVLRKNEASQAKKQIIMGSRPIQDIKVEDLIYIQKLGQGQFGSVYLVQHKTDKSLTYALKSVNKNSVVEQSLEKHIQQERQVLEMVHFPFIMSYVRTFKDQHSVYFLVEYIKGIELFHVIRDLGIMTVIDTQFYIGSLLLALEYLHSKNIIYRDIKPENVMVNYQGFLYLIDLGTAKVLLKQKQFRTFTIIGTPHYMAPEIMTQKGYSFSVDLWSLGICAYEFLCGGVPYGEECEDPFEIYNEILKSGLKWPGYFKDKKSKIFIEQLLSRQPETRLGASYAGLKANAWFRDFDWDDLFNKEIEPPYLPSPSKLLSETELQKRFQDGKLVVNVIKQEDRNNINQNKKSKTPDWDHDF